MASSKKVPSPDLLEVVRQSALKHLRRGSRVAIGLSGGVDSIVMFDLVHRLRVPLDLAVVAIHVNHGWSANAGDWEHHCAELCRAHDVPFESVALRMTAQPGVSREAAARDARYEALTRVARRLNVRVVALAHHLDDQAETVMLQMLRGGSPRGIAAMPEWRTRGDVCLWRPLLSVPRATIVDDALANGLSWVEDESNNQEHIKRNYLRHRVLPLVEPAFAGYRVGLARAARRAQEFVQLADDLAAIDSTTCLTEKGVSVTALRELPMARARNLIHAWLSSRGLPVPETDRLAEFIRQAVSAHDDRHPMLHLNIALRLVRSRGSIKIVPVPLAEPLNALWHGEAQIRLPHGTVRFTRTIGSGIDAAKLPQEGLAIRSRRGGERFRPAADRPTRTLKNLLQEAGIPAPLRSDWPLIVAGSSIVAVPDVGVGVDWQCPSGGPGWAVAWDICDPARPPTARISQCAM